MPPGPGMFSYLNRCHINKVIASVPEQYTDFAESLKEQALNYLEAKSQIIPMGIFASIMPLPAVIISLIKEYFAIDSDLLVYVYCIIAVLGIFGTFILRKYLMKKIKTRLINRCQNDVKKLAIIENFCNGPL